MIEFLSMLAIWCGSPTFETTKQDVFKCRQQIFDCVYEMSPKVLTHPKNDKLIKNCIETNTF